jgi:hypothetical protein
VEDARKAGLGFTVRQSHVEFKDFTITVSVHIHMNILQFHMNVLLDDKHDFLAQSGQKVISGILGSLMGNNDLQAALGDLGRGFFGSKITEKTHLSPPAT